MRLTHLWIVPLAFLVAPACDDISGGNEAPRASELEFGTPSSVVHYTGAQVPVAVRVLGRDKAALPGTTVSFRIQEGTGTISPTEGVADTTGIVRAVWTIGAAGSTALEASVSGTSVTKQLRLEARRLDVVGTYALVEAISPVAPSQTTFQPLPVLVRYDHADTQIDLVAGTLILLPDSSYSQSELYKYVKGTLGGRIAPGTEYTRTSGGRYSVRGDSVTYYLRSNGVEQPGRAWQASDSTVTNLLYDITRPGVFRRRP